MSSPDQCNILDLNDDCFYHIYTFLPVIDWCSLRETCTRFRTISDYCFARRSETFQLRQLNDSTYNLSVAEVKCVLRNFGKFIKTLSINQKHFEVHEDCSILMPFLDHYCQSLVDLKLVNFNLPTTKVAQCSRLFSNLERLVVDQWDVEEAFSGCLSKCVSLKELELIRLFNIAGDILANMRIESLETFTMSDCVDINYDAIKSFLAKNCQITQVKLFRIQFRDDHDARRILEDAADALPKLEVLSLHLAIGFMPNLLPVIKMTSLKKLEVSLMFASDSTVNQLLAGLATHNKIEHLHLALFRCTDVSIRHLTSLKSLKILKFTETNELDGDICRELATGLSGLEEIHIVECNDTTFNEVKEFVVHVPNLRRIIFNRADDSQTSITQEMFFSLVESRKSQATKESLLLFLNDDDLREVQNEFQWNGMEKALVKHANVLQMLPLEKEHRRTVYEYASGFMRPMGHKMNLSDDIDEDYIDEDEYSDDWYFE